MSSHRPLSALTLAFALLAGMLALSTPARAGALGIHGYVTDAATGLPVGNACVSAVAGTPEKTAYLPNITKTLGGPTGWQTPFIAQNTGSVATTLEATFYRFLNGQCVARRVINNVAPGTSFADVPNNDTDLPGDTQFAVVVKSFNGPAVAVVNEHAGTGARAEALAYTGAIRGAPSVFLPNITRRFFGYMTPSIIQDLGSGSATVNAKFVSFDGTAPTITVSRTIAAAKRISPTTAMGYAASSRPDTKYFLPNVTRTLGGTSGWTTPILLQSGTATGATLKWYRFSDGLLMHTQTVVLPAGAGIRIDPRTIGQLPDNMQFAVVVESSGGETLAAIVMELAEGGDNAMIYEGFPASAP